MGLMIAAGGRADPDAGRMLGGDLEPISKMRLTFMGYARYPLTRFPEIRRSDIFPIGIGTGTTGSTG
jgi:hypothetical protein